MLFCAIDAVKILFLEFKKIYIRKRKKKRFHLRMNQNEKKTYSLFLFP